MNQNQEKNLTIIVLTYNSLQVVGNCLKNLNLDKYKVVVVDNASKDGTVAFVKNNFPQAQLIELSKNIGYGNGNNVALEKVDTEFALILNPDAMMFEKDIEIVLDVMRKNDKIAMAGPLVIDGLSASKQDEQNRLKQIKNIATANFDDGFVVDFLVGAALFMKMSLMKKIGFFDEKIFLFYEDDELCYRVKKNACQNVVISDAKAFHLSGKSSGNDLKILAKKSWHMTWSKLYWKKIRKGNLAANKTAARLVLVNFIKLIFSALIFNKNKLAQNSAAMKGAFSFLVGLQAFDENKISRG